jgi:hypothetical protein
MAAKQSPFKALVQNQLDAPALQSQTGEPTDQSANQSASRSVAQPVSQSLILGRRRGKSSDPNFLRMTVYVRRTTVEALEATNMEFSEVVQEALDAWLQRR